MNPHQKLEHARWLMQLAMRADSKAQCDQELEEALRLQGAAMREIQMENQKAADDEPMAIGDKYD